MLEDATGVGGFSCFFCKTFADASSIIRCNSAFCVETGSGTGAGGGGGGARVGVGKFHCVLPSLIL